jgi:mannose-6-phosphate isomerase-like protein (cupin superfamily)
MAGSVAAVLLKSARAFTLAIRAEGYYHGPIHRKIIHAICEHDKRIPPMSDNSWQIFDLDKVRGKLTGKAVEYLEFLNVPAVNCGIYFLAAGSTDMQAPHDEDEVYLVLNGRARMRLGDEERVVGPGSLLYVSATTEHSFFEIEEDMTLLVVFAASPRERN